MPPQPGWIQKANGIIKFIENPCYAPWTVYIETALPALGTAVLELMDFGLGDVVRGALRPKGLRSGKHGRRRKPRGKHFRGIPEIGNLIGSMIPGTERARGRHITAGQRHLWLVDGALQRVLWYWLVADITLDFAYNWTSAIQKSEFCQKQGNGYAQSESKEDRFWFTLAGAWASITTDVDVVEVSPAVARNAACWNGGLPFTSIVSMSVTNLGTGGFIEIRTGDPSGSGQIVFTAEVNPATGKHEAVGFVESPGPFQIWSYRTSGGPFEGQCVVTTMGS